MNDGLVVANNNGCRCCDREFCLFLFNNKNESLVVVVDRTPFVTNER